MIGEWGTTGNRWNQATPKGLISQCACRDHTEYNPSPHALLLFFLSSSPRMRSYATHVMLSHVRATSCFFNCSCFNNGGSNGERLLSCGPPMGSHWEVCNRTLLHPADLTVPPVNPALAIYIQVQFYLFIFSSSLSPTAHMFPSAWQTSKSKLDVSHTISMPHIQGKSKGLFLVLLLADYLYIYIYLPESA